MKIKIGGIIVGFGLLLSSILLILGVEFQINFLFGSVLVIWITSIIYASIQVKKRTSFLLFIVCIFVFLIGRNVSLLLQTGSWMEEYSVEQYTHLLVCLYLTLICILVGYMYTSELKLKKDDSANIGGDTLAYQRKFFKVIMYVVVPIYLYYLLQRVVFVQTYSYLEYYNSFEYSSVILFSISNQLLYISFLGFLMTLPPKNEATKLVLIFLLLSVLNWFTGQRNITLLNIMIIVWYYAKRDVTGQKDLWLGKFEKTLLIVAIPCIISVSFYYSYWRLGEVAQDISFIDSIFEFFIQQGNSNNIIIYSQTLKDQLPEPHWRYFFTPLIGLFAQNKIVLSLGFSQSLKAYTLDYAMYGYNLGSTLSYILLGQGYLDGMGIGSSYIAEAYLSLGYWGLGCYSLFLGFFLKKIENLLKAPWVFGIIGLLCFRSLLITPREVALSWIIPGVNFTNILFLLIFYVLLKREKVYKRGILKKMR